MLQLLKLLKPISTSEQNIKKIIAQYKVALCDINS